ncbi:MAG: manganese-dependent ADP-ribose/CDP-alcohol diphosphatase [Salibacteraceae bacterium]|jgi:predicted phosphodiesterase
MRELFMMLLVTVHFLSNSQELSFGLIADCQYCHCEYSQRWNNNYNKGPIRLTEAVNTFNDQKLDGVFHLGDLIDRDIQSFAAVVPIFEKVNAPHYHVLGNHDFSVAPEFKSVVTKKLKLDSTYYRLSYPQWEVLVLDGTDISTYKWKDSIQINQADSIRKYFLSIGRSQALPWNGAIGKVQLDWLQSELTQIDKSGKNTLILCHFPVYPKSDANLWNDIEVLSILEQHSSVKAFINGHHHPGNYQQLNGIHYLTLQGMVLTPDKNSFCIGHLSKDQILIEGFGREIDRILQF